MRRRLLLAVVAVLAAVWGLTAASGITTTAEPPGPDMNLHWGNEPPPD